MKKPDPPKEAKKPAKKAQKSKSGKSGGMMTFDEGKDEDDVF